MPTLSCAARSSDFAELPPASRHDAASWACTPTRSSRTASTCRRRCRRRHRPRLGRGARGRRRSRAPARSTIERPSRRRVDDRPGHEPRHHRQGQPAEHARLRHAARQRRAGAGAQRVDRPHRQHDALARHDRRRRHRAGARTRRCAIPTNWWRVLVRRHGREGRRRRLRRQRLERGHQPWEFGTGYRPRTKPSRCCADRSSPIAASTARRGGALQGDPAAQHARRRSAAAGRHAGLHHASATRRTRSSTSGPCTRHELEQRRVDVDAARRRRARQLLDRAILESDRPKPRRRTPQPGARRPTWTTTTQLRAERHGSFLVAAYRRPDFRVDVTLPAPSTPIAGDALKAS